MDYGPEGMMGLMLLNDKVISASGTADFGCDGVRVEDFVSIDGVINWGVANSLNNRPGLDETRSTGMLTMLTGMLSGNSNSVLMSGLFASPLPSCGQGDRCSVVYSDVV